MYRIKKSEIDADYKEDCLRIQKALKSFDCEVGLDDAYDLWCNMSEDDYCAGWLILPNNDREIFMALLPYLEEVI